MEPLKPDMSLTYGGVDVEGLVPPEIVQPQTTSKDENPERGNWSSKAEFLLSCIGYAVGLGNVWRFPYLCYRNGGGAFLIPYTLMLAFAGLPMFFMELVLGQYASLGPISVWRISPFFKGVGYAMVTISALVAVYYNVIISYTVYYFFASFRSEVPWATCNNTWNTPMCKMHYAASVEGNITDLTTTTPLPNDTTVSPDAKPKSPAEEYWENHVLEISSGIDDLGSVRWELALCLLFSWTVVFLCLIKGIKSSGKVVYFTATFPYVVLTILIIRGATLPGAIDGVKFYIIPDFHRLLSAKVWGDAAVQIFYSLGPAWGGLITMASYNRFHNNCYMDAILVSTVNCGTSVYAGFAIFSVVGFMAKELGVDVAHVTADGPGLAFVAYPEGLARMPVAPFWSVIFFFMLFTLGLDSMFTSMETVIVALVDEFPRLLRPHKTKFTLFVCIFFFFISLPHVTQGGMYIVNLMDWYCGSFSVLAVSISEVFVVMHVYGYRRFIDDIELMLGFRPNLYWRICWTVLTPVLIIFIIVFNAIKYKRVRYNDHPYPGWSEVMGWLMMFAGILPIPVFMLVKFYQHIGTYKNFMKYVKRPWTGETLRNLVRPSPRWGPALQEHWRKHHRETDMIAITGNDVTSTSMTSSATDGSLGAHAAFDSLAFENPLFDGGAKGDHESFI